MVSRSEDPARPFLNSPELIRQSLTVSSVKHEEKSNSAAILNKIIEWLFPGKHDSPLPQKTYHTKNMPS
jgi:hypothetical protein